MVPSASARSSSCRLSSGSSRTDSTLDGALPIVGRSRELGALLRVLDDEGPRVCFVYGMTGIGKSALLNEFARVCRDRPC